MTGPQSVLTVICAAALAATGARADGGRGDLAETGGARTCQDPAMSTP
jgi:hypothetical protein